MLRNKTSITTVATLSGTGKKGPITRLTEVKTLADLPQIGEASGAQNVAIAFMF